MNKFNCKRTLKRKLKKNIRLFKELSPNSPLPEGYTINFYSKEEFEKIFESKNLDYIEGFTGGFCDKKEKTIYLINNPNLFNFKHEFFGHARAGLLNNSLSKGLDKIEKNEITYLTKNIKDIVLEKKYSLIENIPYIKKIKIEEAFATAMSNFEMITNRISGQGSLSLTYPSHIIGLINTAVEALYKIKFFSEEEIEIYQDNRLELAASLIISYADLLKDFLGKKCIIDIDEEISKMRF